MKHWGEEMNIDEVTEILGLTRALIAPQHVFITEEGVSGEVDGRGSFRGLQPRARGDVIFMSKDADETTPIHETIHAQWGLEETLTKPLTRIIHAKYQFIKRFPVLKEILKKPVKYRQCSGDCAFPQAHSQKFKGRVQHFVRVT